MGYPKNVLVFFIVYFSNVYSIPKHNKQNKKINENVKLDVLKNHNERNQDSCSLFLIFHLLVSIAKFENCSKFPLGM